jgi:hypothetical protein
VSDRWRARRAPLLLGLLALCLYLPGFWWGAPSATGPDRIHGWAVDDETPLGPLAQVNNILHPQEVQNLGYPLMHSFMVVAAYAPYLGWLKVSGAWAGAEGAEYPYGFRDPVAALRGLSRIGHLVSVLLGVVVVLGAWAAGRAMWDERTGVLAGLVTMVMYPMFYYSRTGNVDVPMMAFAAMAMAAYARAIRTPATPTVAIVLGAAAGFALATKEQILGIFLPVAPVLLVLHGLQLRAAGRGGLAAWKVPALAALSLVLAFGIGSGWFVDPTRFFAHVAFVQERMALARTGQLEFVPIYPDTLAGHLGLAGLLAGFTAQALTLPGLLLAGAGLLWAARSDRRALLLALPVATYLALLFFSARTGQLRYLMPVAFILGLFAARALTVAWESGRRGLRVGAVVAGSVVLGLGFLRGIDLTWAMLRDGRHAAATWMAAQAVPGDRVEYFGPAYKLPALAASLDVQRAAPHRGPLLPELRDDATAAAIAAGWAERRPRFILLSPDWSSRDGEPFPASLPPQVFAALHDGSLGYRLAATFETPPLLPWVRRPPLDYPLVNTPLRVFVPEGDPLR